MFFVQHRLVADRYRLVAQLGKGAMGRVWRARDELLQRDVAIKELLIPAGLTTEDKRQIVQRALREARAIARVDQANVVRILDAVTASDTPWIVMEFVSGPSLLDAIRAEGRLEPARVAWIGLGMVAGLRAVHHAGLLHRDIKPANVLLADDGRVVLTDFGLAIADSDPALTQAGYVLGSPAYLAPERVAERPVGPASDLWSLGATLYAAVEGKSPFRRESTLATLAALAADPVPLAPHAGPLAMVLEGLLRKEPDARLDLDEAERLLSSAAVGAAPLRSIGRAPDSREPSPDGSDTLRSAEGNAATVRIRRRGARPAKVVVAAAATVAALALSTVAALAVTTLRIPGGEARGSSPVSSPTAQAVVGAGSPSTAAFGSPSGQSGLPSRSATPSASAKRRTSPPRSTAPSTKTPVVVDQWLVNQFTGMCVDVPGADPATTAPLQVWECYRGAGQAFTLPGDGTIQAFKQCLTVKGMIDGSEVLIRPCTGNSNQLFQVTGAGEVKATISGGCVEVTSANTNNGNHLQVRQCKGTANQRWYFGG